jgi:hypothetical protein
MSKVLKKTDIVTCMYICDKISLLKNYGKFLKAENVISRFCNTPGNILLNIGIVLNNEYQKATLFYRLLSFKKISIQNLM